MVDFLVEFEDPQTGYKVIIDDDGRVAYAYLCGADREIVADVWLYNRCATPVEPEWDHRPTNPFANSLGFVRTDLDTTLPTGATDLSVGWEMQDASESKVMIYLRHELWAIMAPGTTPGFCRLAKQDGPLARRLPAQL